MTEFEIDNPRFGAFLAEERGRLGMTQKELARRLFVTDKAVSKWERGLCLPDTPLLMPLAEILGVTVTELLEGRRIRPAGTMEAGEVERLVKKALPLFSGPRWPGPLFFLLLIDLGVEWRLFSLCYHQLCLPYYLFALPVRLLFLAAGLRLAPPRRDVPADRAAHLLPAAAMAAVVLAGGAACFLRSGPAAGLLLREALRAAAVVLAAGAGYFALRRSTRGDLFLQGHILSALSAVLTLMFDQSFPLREAGEVYKILLGAPCVYLLSLAMLAGCAALCRRRARKTEL